MPVSRRYMSAWSTQSSGGVPMVKNDVFVFFNDTATTEIYTLSLHDALPICKSHEPSCCGVQTKASGRPSVGKVTVARSEPRGDRKSTRLNSSHANISYAVFCLNKRTCGALMS